MSNVPGVEHRDPQYFGYYAQLQHQVSALEKVNAIMTDMPVLAKYASRHCSYFYLPFLHLIERTQII